MPTHVTKPVVVFGGFILLAIVIVIAVIYDRPLKVKATLGGIELETKSSGEPEALRLHDANHKSYSGT